MPRDTIKHPARLVPLAFLITIAIGTALLMLPMARAGEGSAPLLTALFTAVSAACVTGLVTVDTATYWTGFGQTIILILFQIGGIGIMSGATLLGLLVNRRLQLSSRLVAQTETRLLGLGDIIEVLRLVVTVTLIVELSVAAFLTLHLHFAYHEPWTAALWNGVFHAVSAFNNAGFSTYSDNLMGFVADPVVILPITIALIIGGLGSPVLYEFKNTLRKARPWSVHTRITLLGSALLLIIGTVAILGYEWRNPATLGPLGTGAKILAALFHSAVARTAGFNSLDISQLHTETLTVHYILMFIGGGSAGTAGGIKVTTFFLLFFVVWAEIRGNTDTTVFNRRIASETQRQALVVVLLGTAMVSLASLILLTITPFSMEKIVFETISAFATVGLSTGITADLPPLGQVVIITLMFVGRVGTITVATALALRSRSKPYRYPEERPIVG
ncbi:TrkH family potassium uptake protein [Pseudomonas duriflava]|uniref:TrkH family potassium uptake protein n=1 Tax=Pseudomonas duriflava TaxID=459528 RepID=UPI001FCBFA32|nr:potassium transporter TrkG [Pseudomonas duriflava]